MRRFVDAITGIAGLAFVAGVVIVLLLVVGAVANEARRDQSYEWLGGLGVALIVPGVVLWWWRRERRR